MVGTGGIGFGITMRLEGDHTLGREESRAVQLLEGRDYCKLHIVFHYVRRLLQDDVQVIPIGKVGSDDTGRTLLREIDDVGLSLTNITTVEGLDTLFAVAFSYPSGEGGNLTTSNSASASVGPVYIRSVEDQLSPFRGDGIAVALPEVPLAARAELLQLASELQFLRVAAFVSGEAGEVLAEGLLQNVDVIALNQDEACAFAGLSHHFDSQEIATRTVEHLRAINNRLFIVVTAGRHGSWSWDGESIQHAPAFITPVQSTAGAGDAHLAGILTGLTNGIGLHDANRFGSLISAMKVRSPHAINPTINARTVLAAAHRVGFELPQELRTSLGRIDD